MSKKSNPTPPAEPTVTRATLEETPGRALKLLLGIGTSIPVRTALEQRGFSEEDRQEGWTLLQQLGGYRPAPAPGLLGAPGATVDIAVRNAVVELDAWDEDGFRIVRATLERRYPALAKTVFDGLTASVGPEAVIGVATLLDRLAALEKSKDKDDRGAIALLAKRGIDAAERRRLHDLVITAQSATPLTSVPSDASLQEEADAKRLASLVALRAWYEEWSSIARSVLKRRDRLIQIGLAKRKLGRTSDHAAPPPPSTPAAT